MDQKINKKKILVIGGTGFIGHNLVKKSVEKNLEVTSLSLGSNTKNKKISGARYIFKDLTIIEILNF